MKNGGKNPQKRSHVELQDDTNINVFFFFSVPLTPSAPATRSSRLTSRTGWQGKLGPHLGFQIFAGKAVYSVQLGDEKELYWRV